jgi:hypothetical protein
VFFFKLGIINIILVSVNPIQIIYVVLSLGPICMKIVMLTRKNNKNMTNSSRILNRNSLIDKMKLKKDTRYPNQHHHPGA